MSILCSLIISLSMFSRIPMPRVEWSSKNLRWTMAFFPLVGVAVGGVVLLWNWLAALLGFGAFLRGAGFALLPLLITGGIHMDGFCDTVDALASHASLEKKQEILQDPHTGAFAVMAAAAYLLCFAALGSEVAGGWETAGTFACIFVLSRCLSGLGVVWFPNARGSGLAHAFADAAAKRASGFILVVVALVDMAAMVWLGGIPGGVAILCALAIFGVYRVWLIRQFGGLSGDLAGWFVQVCELCALAGLVFAGKITALA